MRPARRQVDRRGVTLLEMLVVVALVVLMMVILASIFQAATGAMSTMRTNQELDDELRLLDLTIRQDLAGTTATMTPPNNPLNKTGYFEYGENAPADAQGEDTDDYLAFTSKAPEGQVYVGRVWIPPQQGIGGGANGAAPNINQAVLPTTITSQYAEVIYFLRNGNLYRRVLLIVPERQGKIAVSSVATANVFVPNLFSPQMFNTIPNVVTSVSWPGVNDVSARPNDGPNANGANVDTPNPNDLGTLTNRENRYARQRCGRDFWNNNNLAGGPARGRDGVVDDGNNDGIPDYYSTLTWTQVHLASLAAAGSGNPTGLMNEDSGSMPGGSIAGGYPRISPTGSPNDLYAFPFIYPGMYSMPEHASLDGVASPPVGWLHALDANTVGGAIPPGSSNVILNHAPLDLGDSLPVPSQATQFQTWWGFPTYRETASTWWHDPVYSPTAPGGTNGIAQQVLGLQSFPTTAVPPPQSSNFLPQLGYLPPLGTPGSPSPPFGTFFPGGSNPPAGRTIGTPAFLVVAGGVAASQSTTYEQLSLVWDDDLIMSGVRSFDVKAYDQNSTLYGSIFAAGYHDLGYAATAFAGQGNYSLVTGTPLTIFDGNHNPRGFGHEGRMPPNLLDNRIDAQRPINNSGGFNLIGDNSPGLNRIRRVWDSWSTDYTNAPAIDVNLRGSPIQPYPLDRPIYPSYPPPYPQALRGLQIQIRVVDPKNEKVKVLTIRQDFSDKL